jgi:hypothetical protein
MGKIIAQEPTVGCRGKPMQLASLGGSGPEKGKTSPSVKEADIGKGQGKTLIW